MSPSTIGLLVASGAIVALVSTLAYVDVGWRTGWIGYLSAVLLLGLLMLVALYV